jgi:mRNA interferase MazF
MPANPEYVPDRCDVVWVDFDPQTGREQAGRRPALVLSPSRYNRRVGLAVVCPITSQVKGYSFEVPIPDGEGISGVILSDQVKSFDWRRRRAAFSCQLPESTIVEVCDNIASLLQMLD